MTPLSFLSLDAAQLRERGMTVAHLARRSAIDSRRLGRALAGGGLGTLTSEELERLLPVVVEQGLLRK